MDYKFTSYLRDKTFSATTDNNQYIKSNNIIDMSNILINDINESLKLTSLKLPFDIFPKELYFKMDDFLHTTFIKDMTIIKKLLPVKDHIDYTIEIKPKDLLDSNDFFYLKYIYPFKDCLIKTINNEINNVMFFAIPPLKPIKSEIDKDISIINNIVAYKDTVSLRMTDYININTSKRYINIDMLLAY